MSIKVESSESTASNTREEFYPHIIVRAVLLQGIGVTSANGVFCPISAICSSLNSKAHYSHFATSTSRSMIGKVKGT